MSEKYEVKVDDDFVTINGKVMNVEDIEDMEMKDLAKGKLVHSGYTDEGDEFNIHEIDGKFFMDYECAAGIRIAKLTIT